MNLAVHVWQLVRREPRRTLASAVGVAIAAALPPKDAFLVANLDYVASQTASPAISFVLASATGDP